MILKKFYGQTIQQALKDAKEQLGQDVILLESMAPNGERPASVTVMVDEKLETAKPEPEKKEEEVEDAAFRNVFYKRTSVKPADTKPVTKKTTPALPAYDEEEATEPAPKKQVKKVEPDPAPTSASKKPELKKKVNDLAELPEPKGLDDPLSSMSRRPHPIIEIKSDEQGMYVGRDISVTREISAIHRRLEQLESMLGESIITASLDYASHPAFQQLLNTGIRATTIAGWFRQVMNKGIDPFEQMETFRYEISRIIRDALNIAMPQAAQPNMVFVGPSGSGKTTLIMKLATSPEFLSGRKIAIVSVVPRVASTRYTILEPFAADHNIPFFRVKDGIDVSKLMRNLVEYDHVLYDTPSISLEKKTAFREYWKIRQILASVMPLEVHFVLNATMENYYFREEYATNHPLQPDYVAVTHLDETDRWGHLIPFLKTLGCGVRFISLGPAVPDDISAFSPTWFAEKILASS